jgi:hypothetical protein
MMDMSKYMRRVLEIDPGGSSSASSLAARSTTCATAEHQYEFKKERILWLEDELKKLRQ